MDDQIPTVEGEPLFNPSSPKVIANPYPYYDRLRRAAPMLRGLVAQAVTARRVEEMRAHIQEMVGGLIDRVEAQGHMDIIHMDIIEDFAFPLSATVICDMPGIPIEDRAVFGAFRRGNRMYDGCGWGGA
jgi:hypothetical protein